MSGRPEKLSLNERVELASPYLEDNQISPITIAMELGGDAVLGAFREGPNLEANEESEIADAA